MIQIQICYKIGHRAKDQQFLSHSLRGGESHNPGYHVLRQESILHGKAGGIVSSLATGQKTYDMSYASLGLPPIPSAVDRSEISFHDNFTPEQEKLAGI